MPPLFVEMLKTPFQNEMDMTTMDTDFELNFPAVEPVDAPVVAAAEVAVAAAEVEKEEDAELLHDDPSIVSWFLVQ